MAKQKKEGDVSETQPTHIVGGKEKKMRLVDKPGYKKFIAMLYGWGASVVIIGALFKILHWPGANIMLMIGMGTEAIIFFFSAFERPHPEYDWDWVYPALEKNEDGTRKYAPGEAPSYYAHGSGVSANENLLSEKLEEMLAKANVTPAVFENLSAGLENLTKTTQNLSNLTSMAGVNQSYAAEMGKMTEHISTLNKFYTDQIQASKVQAESNAKLQEDVNKIMETLSSSLQSSLKYREEIDELSKKVAALNKMYGQMLAAMQNANPTKA